MVWKTMPKEPLPTILHWVYCISRVSPVTPSWTFSRITSADQSVSRSVSHSSQLLAPASPSRELSLAEEVVVESKVKGGFEVGGVTGGEEAEQATYHPYAGWKTSQAYSVTCCSCKSQHGRAGRFIELFDSGKFLVFAFLYSFSTKRGALAWEFRGTGGGGGNLE